MEQQKTLRQTQALVQFSCLLTNNFDAPSVFQVSAGHIGVLRPAGHVFTVVVCGRCEKHLAHCEIVASFVLQLTKL